MPIQRSGERNDGIIAEARISRNEQAMYKVFSYSKIGYQHLFCPDTPLLTFSMKQYKDKWDGISVIIGDLDRVRHCYALGYAADIIFPEYSLLVTSQQYSDLTEAGASFDLVYDSTRETSISLEKPSFFSEYCEILKAHVKGELPEQMANAKAVQILCNVANQLYDRAEFVLPSKCDSVTSRASSDKYLHGYAHVRSFLQALTLHDPLAPPLPDTCKVASRCPSWILAISQYVFSDKGRKGDLGAMTIMPADAIHYYVDLTRRWSEALDAADLCVKLDSDVLDDEDETARRISAYACAIGIKT